MDRYYINHNPCIAALSDIIPHFNEFYSCAVYTKSENPMKGTD